jgi:hypothetical protein
MKLLHKENCSGAASPEIPRITQNLKAHYRIRMIPPPFPILSKINPPHTPIPLIEDPFESYTPIYVSIFQAAFSPGFPTEIMYPPLLA